MFNDGIGFIMTTQMDEESTRNSNMELVCREIVDINAALDISVTVTCMQCSSLTLVSLDLS